MKKRNNKVEDGWVPPVSAPLSSPCVPPSTLAAILFTMFKIASKGKEQTDTTGTVRDQTFLLSK